MNKIKAMMTMLMVIVVVSALFAGQNYTTEKQVVLTRTELKVLKFETDKRSYSVGDPVRLKIQLNKSAYVYVLNVDKETGKSYLVFPNKYSSRNRVKAGRTLVIPPKNADWSINFKEPGYEEFVLIASTKKQNFNISSPSKGTIFPEVNNPKLLTFRRRTSTRRSSSGGEETVMVRYTVLVRDNRRTSRQRPSTYMPTGGGMIEEQTPIVLLNVSPLREVYFVGDTIEAAFGSTYDGYVYLIMLYKDGREDLIKEYEVSAGEIVTKKFVVTTPEGEQYLVAVYSPTPLEEGGGTRRRQSSSLLAMKALNLAGIKGFQDAKGLISLENAGDQFYNSETPAYFQIVRLVVRR